MMERMKRINHSAQSELIVHKKIHVISLILLAITGLSYLNTHISNRYIDIHWVTYFFFFTSLISLFFSCVHVFKDMYDIPTADVKMALPLSANERFASKLFTVCYIWIFPFLFFLLIGMTGSIAMNNYMDMQDFVGRANMLPISTVILMNLRVLLWAMCIILYMIAITVLCVSCIGSKAEAIYIPCILTHVFSFLLYVTKSFFEEYFGNIMANHNGMEELFFVGYSACLNDIWETSSIWTVLISILISLFMIGIALWTYRRRDAKTVGYPIVYRGFFEVLMISILLIMFIWAHVASDSVSGILLFVTFVGTIVLRIIVSRKDLKFSKMIQWSLIFVLYYVLFLGTSFLAFQTNSFGHIYSKPSKVTYLDSYEITLNFNTDIYFDRELQDSERFSEKFTIETDQVDQVADICAMYVKKQNDSMDYFLKRMFGGDLEEGNACYPCYVNIEVRDYEHSVGDQIYRAKIYLSRDEIRDLYLDLEELR